MTKQGKQPTAEEFDRRVEHARLLIGKALYRSEIKRELSKRYGVTTRSAEKYITRATEQIRESVERSDGELISESLAVYEQIIRDPKSSDAVRIKARERMDKILGLEVARFEIGKNFREKLQELGVDPDDASTEIREALVNALQATTKAPEREN